LYLYLSPQFIASVIVSYVKTATSFVASVSVSPATCGGVAFVFSLRFYRRSIEPGGKLKKQADFARFNGLYMLL